jgi:hypothetical protein
MIGACSEWHMSGNEESGTKRKKRKRGGGRSTDLFHFHCIVCSSWCARENVSLALVASIECVYYLECGSLLLFPELAHESDEGLDLLEGDGVVDGRANTYVSTR